MTDPTLSVLLIHGAWHTPKHYDRLGSALATAGLEVHCPPLPSMNQARPPNADLSTDTDYIRNYAERLADAGKHVLALMHSYGGQVGTNALTGLGVSQRTAAGKTGGVAHLVYMCGFALPRGVSMEQNTVNMGDGHLLPLAFTDAPDGTKTCNYPEALVDPGVNAEETAAYVKAFVLWNGKAMSDPVLQCAWREIPVTYIYATLDKLVPFHYQQAMVQKMQAEGVKVATYDVAAGHCPN